MLHLIFNLDADLDRFPLPLWDLSIYNLDLCCTWACACVGCDLRKFI